MRNLVRLSLLLFVVSCAEPTDRPEDCSTNQFFDEARKLCVTCPAITAPECADGCGFEIEADQQGCPVAVCMYGDDCDHCDEREYFDARTLTCEACDGPETCEDDSEPTREFVDGQCVFVCR